MILSINTTGEGFYNITQELERALGDLPSQNGALHVFCLHTSCALAINESYDPDAKEDMENFLKHLAPHNLRFIKHTAEGPDDSPSHMKSILMQTSLLIPIENGKFQMGTWQGIYLTEFRTAPHTRKLRLQVLKGA